MQDDADTLPRECDQSQRQAPRPPSRAIGRFTRGRGFTQHPGLVSCIKSFSHVASLGLALFVTADAVALPATSTVANGILVGPYLGYKYTAPFGLTVEAELGVARLGIGASNDRSNSKSENSWGPLLNLNLGWSS